MSASTATSATPASSSTKSSTLTRVAGLTSMLLTLTHTLYLLCEVVGRVRCGCLSLTAVLQIELSHGLGDSGGSQLGRVVLLTSRLLGLCRRCGSLLLSSRR